MDEWALSLHKVRAPPTRGRGAYGHIFSDTDDVATHAWACVAFHWARPGSRVNLECTKDASLWRVSHGEHFSEPPELRKKLKKKIARGQIRYSPSMRPINKDPNKNAIKISEQKMNNRHHSGGGLVTATNTPEWTSYEVYIVRAL